MYNLTREMGSVFLLMVLIIKDDVSDLCPIEGPLLLLDFQALILILF